LTYFRKNNYIINGGSVSQRHIMNDYRHLLSIFLLSINNINLSTNNNNMYTSTSNLLQLFRYNKKELMKYIISNVDLTREEFNAENINERIKYYLTRDLSKSLQSDIDTF